LKPSFLLWDKVFQKVVDIEAEKWLLRAIDVALQFFQSELSKNASFRCVILLFVILLLLMTLAHSSQIGLTFLHLAVNSPSSEVRRNVNTVIEASTTQRPQLTNHIMRDALMVFLSEGKPSSKGAIVMAEEQDISWNKHPRLFAILLSTVAFRGDLDLAVREDLLVELVVMAHHHLIRSLLAVAIIQRTLINIFVHLHQVEHHGKHGLIYVKGRGRIHVISLTKTWTNSSSLS
jgi:hypothetical protein